MSSIDDRLKELSITLPEPTAPVANYVPYVRSGNLLFISGQVTVKNGSLEHVGKVGDGISTDEAVEAARLCGINILAQLKAACEGNWDEVKRCVKVGGFVNAASDFTEHPKVVNGCSDLMVDVFGDRGKHARFAVGAGSLPLGVAVEVEAIFELE